MNPRDYVSLLWPKKYEDRYYELEDKYIQDLDMTLVFEAMEDLLEKGLMRILKKVPNDQYVVAYRQEILRDYIQCEGLFNAFLSASHKFYEISNMIKFAFEREYTLYNVLKRLEESDEIIRELYGLRSVLSNNAIRSEGLIGFRQMLDDLLSSDLFSAYIKDLKSIKSMAKVSGLKIGLNLDKDMSPNEAIVLSLMEDPFRYTRRMKKVNRIIGYGVDELRKLPRRLFAPETAIPREDLNELEKIIEPSMQQLIKFCDNFNDVLMEMFGDLSNDLLLYDYGCRLKKDMDEMGLATTQLTSHKQMPHYIKGLYNINLALRLRQEKGVDGLVTNDLTLDPEGNILILTGPNRGGKTTFTQGVGQVIWMGALGLYVPAISVNMPIPDRLFVHFPSEEEETVMFGRLGEECRRFAEIFTCMTKGSVLLMNESFSGTSHLESLTIAKESLSALQMVGATCLFNTHLHELALQVDTLNEKGMPVSYKNLVSGSDASHQSFKISEGEPLGKSYAVEIARKYGVTYEQLVKIKK